MGTLDLNVDLSEEERTFILAVLSRNEALMKKEEARVKKLKSEVHDIRMKSVIKAGQDTTSQCARCFSQLGWIFNRGEPCPQCKHRICPNCRIPLIDQTYSWLCKLCFKQMELQGQSGDWFYSEVKKKNIPAGAELVKQSIKGPHMNGHAGKSVGDEVKRVLTNNNASPAHKRTTSRHSRSSGGETSDDGSANIHKVGFPKDSDQRRLMDLVRSISNKSDSDSGSGHVTVKRVTSRHYGDTDSDSSSSSESDHEAQRSPLPRRGRESEPSSMPASRTDSVRSSIRSSSAVSSEQSTALVETAQPPGLQIPAALALAGSPDIVGVTTGTGGRTGQTAGDVNPLQLAHSSHNDPLTNAAYPVVISGGAPLEAAHNDKPSASSEHTSITPTTTTTAPALVNGSLAVQSDHLDTSSISSDLDERDARKIQEILSNGIKASEKEAEVPVEEAVGLVVLAEEMAPLESAPRSNHSTPITDPLVLAKQPPSAADNATPQPLLSGTNAIVQQEELSIPQDAHIDSVTTAALASAGLTDVQQPIITSDGKIDLSKPPQKPQRLKRKSAKKVAAQDAQEAGVSAEPVASHLAAYSPLDTAAPSVASAISVASILQEEQQGNLPHSTHAAAGSAAVIPAASSISALNSNAYGGGVRSSSLAQQHPWPPPAPLPQTPDALLDSHTKHSALLISDHIQQEDNSKTKEVSSISPAKHSLLTVVEKIQKEDDSDTLVSDDSFELIELPPVKRKAEKQYIDKPYTLSHPERTSSPFSMIVDAELESLMSVPTVGQPRSSTPRDASPLAVNKAQKELIMSEEAQRSRTPIEELEGLMKVANRNKEGVSSPTSPTHKETHPAGRVASPVWLDSPPVQRRSVSPNASSELKDLVQVAAQPAKNEKHNRQLSPLASPSVKRSAGRLEQTQPGEFELGDDEFDFDLEWDDSGNLGLGPTPKKSHAEEEEEKALALAELKASLHMQFGLGAMGAVEQPDSPQEELNLSFDYHRAQTRGDFLDDEIGGHIGLEESSKIVQTLIEEEERRSDTLSIITEVTEPESEATEDGDIDLDALVEKNAHLHMKSNELEAESANTTGTLIDDNLDSTKFIMLLNESNADHKADTDEWVANTLHEHEVKEWLENNVVASTPASTPLKRQPKDERLELATESALREVSVVKATNVILSSKEESVAPPDVSEKTPARILLAEEHSAAWTATPVTPLTDNSNLSMDIAPSKHDVAPLDLDYLTSESSGEETGKFGVVPQIVIEEYVSSSDEILSGESKRKSKAVEEAKVKQQERRINVNSNTKPPGIVSNQPITAEISATQEMEPSLKTASSRVSGLRDIDSAETRQGLVKDVISESAGMKAAETAIHSEEEEKHMVEVAAMTLESVDSEKSVPVASTAGTYTTAARDDYGLTQSDILQFTSQSRTGLPSKTKGNAEICSDQKLVGDHDHILPSESGVKYTSTRYGEDVSAASLASAHDSADRIRERLDQSFRDLALGAEAPSAYNTEIAEMKLDVFESEYNQNVAPQVIVESQLKKHDDPLETESFSRLHSQGTTRDGTLQETPASMNIKDMNLLEEIEVSLAKGDSPKIMKRKKKKSKHSTPAKLPQNEMVSTEIDLGVFDEENDSPLEKQYEVPVEQALPSSIIRSDVKSDEDNSSVYKDINVDRNPILSAPVISAESVKDSPRPIKRKRKKSKDHSPSHPSPHKELRSEDHKSTQVKENPVVHPHLLEDVSIVTNVTASRVGDNDKLGTLAEEPEPCEEAAVDSEEARIAAHQKEVPPVSFTVEQTKLELELEAAAVSAGEMEIIQEYVKSVETAPVMAASPSADMEIKNMEEKIGDVDAQLKYVVPVDNESSGQQRTYEQYKSVAPIEIKTNVQERTNEHYESVGAVETQAVGQERTKRADAEVLSSSALPVSQHLPLTHELVISQLPLSSEHPRPSSTSPPPPNPARALQRPHAVPGACRDMPIRPPRRRSSRSKADSANKSSSASTPPGTVMLDTQSAPNSPHLDSTDGPVAPHNNNKQPVEQCNSIPDIQITTDATTIPPKDHAELDEMKDTFNEEENIDDLFASHKGSHGNLLSTMATSQESIASIYSEAGEGNYGNIAISGDILFGLDYNYKSSILEINIKQCRDLAIVDTKRNRSDPYVKIYLLPDKTKNGKRKTKVKKHTVNPTFDEVIRYGITKSELETRTLWITVWNNDTFGRNDFLGELTIPLDYYHFDDATPRWYPLQDRPKATDDVDGGAHPLTLLTYKGDLILSMRYVTPDKISRENSPTKTKKKHSKPKSSGKGQLEVMVSEARNLTAVRANGSSDPFCKGYLLPDRSKGAKQKTSVIKRDCNPKWNHTFIFEDVSVEDLADRGLELTIWDHDILSSNDFLGGNRLNLGTGRSNGREVDWMDARGDEITIWQSMLDRPNTWIDGGLMLRPNMDRRL